MLREPGSVVRVILILNNGGFAPALASLVAPAFSRQVKWRRARPSRSHVGRLKAMRGQVYGAEPFSNTI